jgi:hypothetical protein
VPHPSSLTQLVAADIADERLRAAHGARRGEEPSSRSPRQNVSHDLQRARVRASLLWSGRQDPETHRRWA